MKKIILFLFLMVIIIFPNNIKAASNDSIIDYELDTSIYYHRIKDGTEKVGNLALLTANNKVAYCIEPGILALKNGVYSSTYDINDTYLSSDKYKMLSLLGYFGYGYNNQNSKEYYMASQELIWKYLGATNTWWTDSNGNIIDIEYYKNKILSYVNNYEEFPNFNLLEKYVVGSKIVIKNNELNNYSLDNKYENIKLNNGALEIDVKEGINSFILKKITNGKKTIFYYREGYQTIGSFEGIYEISKTYELKGEYANIELEKKDYDNKEYKNISLGNAIYGLYDENDNLIDKKSTLEDGKILFDNLPYGFYYIKEIKPSLGYTIDKNKYEININLDSFNTKVTSYEKVIENKIEITKVYDDGISDIMKLEENIEFGLYDNEDNLIEIYKTDKNGNINFLLPYGSYVLKQHTN